MCETFYEKTTCLTMSLMHPDLSSLSANLRLFLSFSTMSALSFSAANSLNKGLFSNWNRKSCSNLVIPFEGTRKSYVGPSSSPPPRKTSPRGQQSRASGNDKQKSSSPQGRAICIDTMSIQYRYDIDTISI